MDCFFWYISWKQLVPFRDGIDFLLISTKRPTSCKTPPYKYNVAGKRAHQILNNILFRPDGFQTVFFTYQNDKLAQVLCHNQISIVCIRAALADRTLNGRLVIFENISRPPTPPIGFWNNVSDRDTKYTLVKKHFASPFHQPAPRLEENLELLSLDAFQVWIERRLRGSQAVNSEIVRMLKEIHRFSRSRRNFLDIIESDYSCGSLSRIVVMPLGKQAYMFSTKHSVVQTQSISLYFDPYDLQSWIGIALVLSAIPILFVVSKVVFSIPGVCEECMNVLLISISILLNVSPHINPKVLQVRPRPIFYLTIGLWLVFVIVITNAYVGVVVSKLTITPPWISKWTSLEQLGGFVVHTTHQTMDVLMREAYFSDEGYYFSTISFVSFCPCLEAGYISAKAQMRNFNTPNHCVEVKNKSRRFNLKPQSLPRILIPSRETCNKFKSLNNWQLPDRLQVVSTKGNGIKFFAALKHVIFYIDGIGPEDDLRVYGRHKPVSKDLEAVIKDNYNVIKDGDQVAVFEQEDYIRAFTEVANHYESDGLRHYSLGGSAVHDVEAHVVNIELDKMISVYHANSFTRYLQRLLENGIRSLWVKWHKRLHPSSSDILLKRYQSIHFGPQPLTMNTNVRSIFIISCVCISLCFLALIFEFAIRFSEKTVTFVNLYRDYQLRLSQPLDRFGFGVRPNNKME